MELDVKDLVELIVKAYERGQKSSISRLSTEVHDLKHEFYQFKDAMLKIVSRVEKDVEVLKKEDSEKIQAILFELSKVVGALEVIDKRIKEELSDISAPHEAPMAPSIQGGDSSPTPTNYESDELMEVLSYRIFGPSGKVPWKMLQMALYVYSQGGVASLVDLYHRFGSTVYNIPRSVSGQKMFRVRFEGGQKLVYLKDDVKNIIDEVVSAFRRE